MRKTQDIVQELLKRFEDIRAIDPTFKSLWDGFPASHDYFRDLHRHLDWMDMHYQLQMQIWDTTIVGKDFSTYRVTIVVGEDYPDVQEGETHDAMSMTQVIQQESSEIVPYRGGNIKVIVFLAKIPRGQADFIQKVNFMKNRWKAELVSL